MKEAKLLAMLMKLQSYVMDNDGIDEDVMLVIDSKITEIMDKLVEEDK